MLTRLSRLIVDRRALIVTVMAAVTVLCGFLAPRVGIITDPAELLPADSSMRRGMEIMEEEFPDSSRTSTLRVMLTGLSDADEDAAADSLADIPGVGAVDFARDDRHLSGDRALYTLSTGAAYDSDEFAAIERGVDNLFAGADMTRVSDDPSAADELPAWIALTAVALLALILVVMTASWVEPLLFLIAIGMAVVCNLGTNIIRGSVADVTFTIGPILQLVLSMDYSMILANRYRQEKAATASRPDAMTKAIRGALPSMASAALTTVVGLLMLCAMSMRIGADFGIVLAKGVAWSLLTVLTVLPALLLACDRWIDATAKPHPNPRLAPLAGLGYRLRAFIAAGFVALLALSAVTASATPVAYALDSRDPIAEVFGQRHRLVLLYENSDEAAAGRLADAIEDEDGVVSLISYPSTLGRQRTAGEMREALAGMGEGSAIDPTMLDLVYYTAHGGTGLERMAPGEFLSEASALASTPMAARGLTASDAAGLARAEKFSDPAALTAPMGAADLARFLSIGEAEARDVLLADAIADPSRDPGTLTLPVFASFASFEVLPDPRYSSALPASARRDLERLSSLTDVGAMARRASYERVADRLGVEREPMGYVFMAHEAARGGMDSQTMTLPDLVDLIRGDIAVNPLFAGRLDQEGLSRADALAPLVDEAATSAPLDAPSLAGALGLDEATASSALAAFAGARGQDPATARMSLRDFTGALVDAAADPSHPLASAIGPEALARLRQARTVMDLAVDRTGLTPAAAAGVLGADPSDLALVYAYDRIDTDALAWRASPQEILHYLLDEPELLASAGAEPAELAAVSRIVDASVAGTALAPRDMAEVVGLDAGALRPLFLLHASRHGDSSAWRMSVQDFLRLVDDRLIDDPDAGPALSAQRAASLRSARTLVDAVVDARPLGAQDLAGLLRGAGAGMDADRVELVLLLAGAREGADPDWTMSIDELFEHIDTEIVDDPRFAGAVDAHARSMLADARARLSEALEELVGPHWSRMVIETSLAEDSPQASALIDRILAGCASDLQRECHLVGQPVISHEVAASFGSENLMITALTALAIFLVIAATFRSAAVPALLVLLVQCGVFLTITVIGWQGYDSYYLAQIIVQCILMGATIDYAILFVSYYRDLRRTRGIADALAGAYDGSIHTIATSGAIMVVVTGVLSLLFENPTVGQICRTISIGAAMAILLILLVLPGLLAAADPLVAGRERLRARH
ncbi:MMPL family transporter [Actinomyces sp. B33]|uniref:MMPL family transporter n=1 Tax=Actinomyces sp. B33 TaxID=2942131 RepID=UPI00233FE26E|nr:MMPL family transporter [Actinomyces sp. B33]MDC4233749.1 MMPL family transporter [Actinomyces sp. B33]